MAVYTFTDGEQNSAALMNTYCANGGLVYITTLTATGTATTAFVDSVFNATYQNYKIFADFSTVNNSTVSFRYRIGGVDDLGATYYDRGAQNTVGTVAAVNNITQTAGFLGATTPNEFAHAELTLFYPQISPRRKAWNLQSMDAWNVQYFSTMGINTTTSAFDGIKFISSSGNITGTFRIYGIRQA